MAKRKLRRYTIQERREAISLYKAGWSSYKVAEMTGCNQSTLIGWLQQEGIPRRPMKGHTFSRISHKTIQAYKLLYEQGYSTGEIGEMYGRHESAIRKTLVRAGVQMRTGGESLKLAYARKRRNPNDGFTGTPHHLTTR